MKNIILYIVILMILYDITLHVYDFFWYLGIKYRFPLRPGAFIKRLDEDFWDQRTNLYYDSFWITYWGIAAILLVTYLLT